MFLLEICILYIKKKIKIFKNSHFEKETLNYGSSVENFIYLDSIYFQTNRAGWTARHVKCNQIIKFLETRSS